MTGCPQRWVSRSANSRALKSAAAPAGTGTIKRTVRCGQSAATTAELKKEMAPSKRPATVAERLEILMALSCSDLCLARFWLSATGSGADVFFVRRNDMRHEIDEAFTIRRFEARQQLVLSSECSQA